MAACGAGVTHDKSWSTMKRRCELGTENVGDHSKYSRGDRTEGNGSQDVSGSKSVIREK